MSAVRILHVDDDPDIREIVGLSLGLNADFEVQATNELPTLSTAVNRIPGLYGENDDNLSVSFEHCEDGPA